MCEFGVLDVFAYTPTEPHGLTSLLDRRQPPRGSLRSARYASPLSVTPEGAPSRTLRSSNLQKHFYTPPCRVCPLTPKTNAGLWSRGSFMKGKETGLMGAVRPQSPHRSPRQALGWNFKPVLPAASSKKLSNQKEKTCMTTCLASCG